MLLLFQGRHVIEPTLLVRDRRVCIPDAEPSTVRYDLSTVALGKTTVHAPTVVGCGRQPECFGIAEGRSPRRQFVGAPNVLWRVAVVEEPGRVIEIVTVGVREPGKKNGRLVTASLIALAKCDVLRRSDSWYVGVLAMIS